MTAFVIFRCGRRYCAIDQTFVGEVTPIPELSHPPGLPATLAGFLNLAGDALPVVDAAVLFALTPDPDVDPLYRHILVLAGANERIGLLVDRVEDIRVIPAAEMIETPSAHTLNDCVVAEAPAGDASIAILDVRRILLAAERARLAELQRAEQARLDALAAS